MNEQNNPQFSAAPEPQWREEHHVQEAHKAMQVVKKHLDAVTTRDARVTILCMAEDAMLRSAQALIPQTPYPPRLPATPVGGSPHSELIPMKSTTDTAAALRVVKARPDDADRIILRASDLQELAAGGRGADPCEPLRESIQGATGAFTILADDVVAAIAGYRVTAGNEVYVWAASSDLVALHMQEFAALADKAVKELRMQFPEKTLCNYLSRTNIPARRAFEALGFGQTALPGIDLFDFFYLPASCV